MNEAPNRRDLLGGAGALAIALASLPALAGDRGGKTTPAATPSTGSAAPAASVPGGFAPAALGYAEDALAPVISAETVSFHYGKHHKAYADKLNELIAGSDLVGKPLADVVKATVGTPKTAIYNNAAQLWNHDFYWAGLKAGGGGAPTGAIADAIKGSFGTWDEAKKQLQQAATSQFGSGWAWLVLEGDKLAVVKTGNADTPLTNSAQKPLLVIDVWEHAYYVDYRNKRADYATALIEKLVSWDAVNARLKA